MATSIIFVPQDYAQAQNTPNQSTQANSRTSRNLEVKWFLGFLPWFTWNNNPNNSGRYNSENYSNNPPVINTANRNRTKDGNHRDVPVPILIPGLAALGLSLIRKNRQEQKQMELE
ncbi:hypothetical protein [Nostoc sp. FACHB-110]|uniref:hypothetical protein n=1 Tax=Nostoc sp. FACHB-110 TaxID=2692834 RepID=UPI001683AAE1|nr:hypothetical protein [Nostoc sp. FACHB-110]MBD2436037.1 hypothetical protein [Nostoc sp. FACHB-110]